MRRELEKEDKVEMSADEKMTFPLALLQILLALERKFGNKPFHFTEICEIYDEMFEKLLVVNTLRRLLNMPPDATLKQCLFTRLGHLLQRTDDHTLAVLKTNPVMKFRCPPRVFSQKRSRESPENQVAWEYAVFKDSYPPNRSSHLSANLLPLPTQHALIAERYNDFGRSEGFVQKEPPKINVQPTIPHEAPPPPIQAPPLPETPLSLAIAPSRQQLPSLCQLDFFRCTVPPPFQPLVDRHLAPRPQSPPPPPPVPPFYQQDPLYCHAPPPLPDSFHCEPPAHDPLHTPAPVQYPVSHHFVAPYHYQEDPYYINYYQYPNYYYQDPIYYQYPHYHQNPYHIQAPPLFQLPPPPPPPPCSDLPADGAHTPPPEGIAQIQPGVKREIEEGPANVNDEPLIKKRRTEDAGTSKVKEEPKEPIEEMEKEIKLEEPE